MKSVRVAEDEGWGADANSGSSSEWAGKIEFEEFENSDLGTNSDSGTTSVHEVTSDGARGSENRGGAIESVALGSVSDLSSIAEGTGACWSSKAEDEYDEGAGTIGVDGEGIGSSTKGVVVASALETKGHSRLTLGGSKRE